MRRVCATATPRAPPGDTALHDASRFGHTAIVELLLDAGADQSVTNKDGLTPFAARSNPRQRCVASLQRGRCGYRYALAIEHNKDDIAAALQARAKKDLVEAAAARRKAFLTGGRKTG